MSETVTLIKENPLLPAEDYVAMREQGFKSIEKLGHEIWTDYNNSDPGITILEAVIYAITDLSYRTGFDIKDLLTPEKFKVGEDPWKQIFYTARQILHNSPLTITDYRKMIIDTNGVRNAWIEPSKEYEVPMWIDYNYFEKRKDEDCGCKDNMSKTCFGRTALDAATQDKAVEFKKGKKIEIEDAKSQIEIIKKAAEDTKDSIETKLKNETDPLTEFQLNQELAIVNKQLEKYNQKLTGLDVDDKLVTEMSEFIPSKIIELEGLYNVMIEYEENVLEEDYSEEVRQQVLQKLSKNRNLCEDFLTVNAVEYIDFGLGASIVLEEYADPDTVLAEVFFRIYKYFTPSIAFYTIKQMLDKNYTIDEIFEGPPLRHGFIETSAIENTDLFRDMRLSDIINEITDIHGIKAITYFHLPFAGFDDKNESSNYFNEWIKFLQAERKIARIFPEKSKVIFCKQRDIITYNTGSATDKRPDRMLKFFKDLKTAERKYKLENIPLDNPVPGGQNMELEDYYPVTYSLPMNYGVSERAGLPGDADEKRKAQALQLKGYLLFFEQLLSNHLVQLNHLRDIYTMDESVTKTYYTKALTEIIGIKENDSLQELLIDRNNHGAAKFDLILKDFTQVLQYLVEPPELFAERRNRFLNHFLARFSEDMSEYEAINRWLVPEHVEKRLIQDKINILKNGEYYKISTGRSKGYDYTKPEWWDTSNVSGTERRVGRLLGFSNTQRHTLAAAFIFAEPVMVQNAKKQWEQKRNVKNQPVSVIKIVSRENKEQVLFTSVEVPEGCCMESLMNDIIKYADNRLNYTFHDNLNHRARKSAGPKGNFWFELFDGPPEMKSSVLLGVSGSDGIHFDNRELRDKTFRELQDEIELINENEGMHLVEHLLLRPKFDEVLDEANQNVHVSFLNICLDKCDLGIGLNEGTEEPHYRKKISRVPAEKCYDKMPWILQYMRKNRATNKFDQSLLFQQINSLNTELMLLKFHRYNDMAQRVQDLQKFGSERINYKIVSNEEEKDESDKVRYSFIILDNNKNTLAQSPYVFSKRTAKQIADGVPPAEDDIEEEIKALMEWFGNEMDWYCEANPCDNNEDAYSFRATLVFPCWPKRLRDATFRNLVEKTIYAQAPAHTSVRVVWLGIPEMARFEKAYIGWLEEMAQTEIPSYEKVNPLVDVINTLKPCGVCEDDCMKEKPTDVASRIKG